MAVAVVSTAHASGSSSSPSVTSGSVSGSNTVGFIIINTTGGVTATSASWNGVAATFVGRKSNGYMSTDIYKVISPAAGATTVAAVLSGSTDWQISAIQVSGSVGGATAFFSDQFIGAWSGSVTVAATAGANDASIDGFTSQYPGISISPNSGQSQVANDGLGSGRAVGTSYKTGSSSTMGWTNTGGGSGDSGWTEAIVIVYAVNPIVGPTNVKTWNGVTQSTGIKTYQGVALASVKSVNGVT